MNGLKEKFGRNLQFIRKAKGYTQAELGELIHLQQRQITRLERGINFPSIETVEKIAEKLEVPVKCFFDFKTDKFSHVNMAITFRAVKFANTLKLFLINENTSEKILKSADNKQFTLDATHAVLSKIAKKYKRPIVVEFTEHAEVYKITMYFPDSSTKTLFYSVKTQEIPQRLARLYEMLKTCSNDAKKLEFVEIALKALDNPFAMKLLRERLELYSK